MFSTEHATLLSCTINDKIVQGEDNYQQQLNQLNEFIQSKLPGLSHWPYLIVFKELFPIPNFGNMTLVIKTYTAVKKSMIQSTNQVLP